MIYFCKQKNRRTRVLGHAGLNGIDYLEIVDGTSGQTTLALTFLNPVGPLALAPANFAITGGESVTGIHVTAVAPDPAGRPQTVRLHVSNAGDFSLYTLAVIDPVSKDTLAGVDPALSAVAFSFKAGCPATGDCAETACCPPQTLPEPEINYLAKDFPGFLQVMYDRLAVIVPEWTERSPADLGVTLVEILAYIADQLSYRQDAVATEAYLGTARSRISLRRLARLVDYAVDEGANARAWVHVEVTSDLALPKGSQVFPRVAGLPPVIVQPGHIYDRFTADTQIVFETMADAKLHKEQNAIAFHTWSDGDCCLPAGATSATLAGTLATLSAGDVLVFEEIAGPNTGAPEDADPTHRCAVRLTKVRTLAADAHTLVDPLTGEAITEIEWAAQDALPFPLCVSSTSDAGHGAQPVPDVSIARGNNVPADHGLSRGWEDLGAVPAAPAPPIASDCTTPRDPVPHFYPALAHRPLTFACPFDTAAPASLFAASASPPAAAITLQDVGGSDPAWQATPDLLGADELAQKFVVEIERDGKSYLRFGDGVYGQAPTAGHDFQAAYRSGNGTVGNVARDTLGHVAPKPPNPHVPTDYSAVRSVRNPLAAAGGRDPATMEKIRATAPFQFLTQLRAVTEDDYGTMAERDARLRAARASLRWTGSWRTAFVTAAPAAGVSWTPALAAAIADELDRMRMAGVDLQVEPAIAVGLRLALHVCVKPGYFRSQVHRALMDMFSAGLPSAANFTFGQTIYASPFIAAAQAVDGVAAVEIAKFQRMDEPKADGAAAGFLGMHRLEIARLDNDPSRPDRGVFELVLDGGL